MNEQYFIRPEVSNSDLSWLKSYWMPADQIADYTDAYRFGNLIDAMITEPERVNFFLWTVDEVVYSKEEFERAERMKQSFYNDPLCRQLLRQAVMQKVSSRDEFPVEYNGFTFTLPVRCKWDLFCEAFDMSGDIKSTTATTQKQFEEAVSYFDYDRQRAWYMDIENRNNDIIIGISKVNYKVFKVPIKRGDSLYNSGKEKYQDLAFRWWYLFHEIMESVPEVLEGSTPFTSTNLKQLIL